MSADIHLSSLRSHRTRAVSTLESVAPVAAMWEAQTWYVSAKPALEFAVALILAAPIAVIVLATMVLVKLTSSGPAFFTQVRLGRNGRPFRMIKIRTMVHDCEKTSGPQWALARDPRTTFVGRFLRKTHLDELPQLWNVLRGDMSLIGPRPERPEFVPQLERAIPHYRGRLRVRPGVTGLAQVQLPPDSDLTSVRRKLAYDLWYVSHVGLWIDIRVVLSTALSVLGVPFGIVRKLFALPTHEKVEEHFAGWPGTGAATARSEMTAESEERPAILYLVHRLPYPPDKGDRIRAYHLLRFLSSRARVFLACLSDEPVPPESIKSLQHLCERLAVVPIGRRRWIRAAYALVTGRSISERAFLSPALAQIVREWAAEVRFHRTLASASSMVQYQRLDDLHDVPAVVDLVDVDSQKWLDYAAAGSGLWSCLYRTEAKRLRALECGLPSWARAATLVSEAETDLFREFCPWPAVRAITNGVDLDYFRPPVEAPVENGCVFVGALDYPPNVDAICWFANEVWPQVRKNRAGQYLYIVGRKPVGAVKRLGRLPGVEVVGQVPDVRVHLAGAAVAVAPLRMARGLQNKVLEAMAMAKPVVASPQALAALGEKDDLPALSAANPREWVEQLGRLLDDAALRRELGALGRDYVTNHHNWEDCLTPFEDLLGLGETAGSASAMPRSTARIQIQHGS